MGNDIEQDGKNFQHKSYWKTLSIIHYAAAIAALFHDFGKANCSFANRINPKIKSALEPYRHEWISLRLFQAFAKNSSDDEWLAKLERSDFSGILSYIKDGIDSDDSHPFNELAPVAQLVAWLILSHHKLPSYPYFDKRNRPSFQYSNTWIDDLSAIWNSPSCNESIPNWKLIENWKINPFGLPNQSPQWCAYACALAIKARQGLIPLLDKQLLDKQDILHQDLFSSHLARLALMLADHHFSSLDYQASQQQGLRSDNYPVYANTYLTEAGGKAYKQQLDEHLIGVATHAERISQALLHLKTELPGLKHNHFLQENVAANQHKKFGWQDQCRKTAENLAEQTLQHGFFGINMASTGCGKTLANAKIMYAIGQKTGQVRFNVALGLRTLTLQTGKVFKEVLKLDDKELSIAVGGAAVKELFEYYQQDNGKNSGFNGSESSEEPLDSAFNLYYGYENLTQHSLSPWLKEDKKKIDELLQAPILVCTVDHLISATEGIKGGRQIGAMLRLLTSDLVLDEPDDFSLNDLAALCRLVHWSGMLGSRVLLSTATLPPALVHACFLAYQAGWSMFAKANLTTVENRIQCAWFDETQQPLHKQFSDDQLFKAEHLQFVEQRVQALAKLPAKRKGRILEIDDSATGGIYAQMAGTIHRGIIELHQNHSLKKKINGIEKSLSIGLVRMANIEPIIGVARQLLNQTVGENIKIHYCVYHSRFPLAIRSHLENILDNVLQRGDDQNNDIAIWENDYIQTKLNESTEDHHIFVVLSSPVAEVGRDHDYDWAIVEPSSMRSIIQIAGRVLRHREKYPELPNIYLLNQNIKSLKQQEICFTKPGFESHLAKLTSSQLLDILTVSQFEIIDAKSRIQTSVEPEYKSGSKNKYQNLVELEHNALVLSLFSPEDMTETEWKAADHWWKNQLHWCGELQNQQRFRQSDCAESYRLWIERAYKAPSFKWFDTAEKDPQKRIKLPEQNGTVIRFEHELQTAVQIDFWIDLNPVPIYQHLATELCSGDLESVSLRFGEIIIVDYKTGERYSYHNQLGLFMQS